MLYSQKELQFIVERIDKRTYDLSEWEQSFFASVKSRVTQNQPLSSKQAKILSDIWDKLENI